MFRILLRCSSDLQIVDALRRSTAFRSRTQLSDLYFGPDFESASTERELDNLVIFWPSRGHSNGTHTMPRLREQHFRCGAVMCFLWPAYCAAFAIGGREPRRPSAGQCGARIDVRRQPEGMSRLPWRPRGARTTDGTMCRRRPFVQRQHNGLREGTWTSWAAW